MIALGGRFWRRNARLDVELPGIGAHRKGPRHIRFAHERDHDAALLLRHGAGRCRLAQERLEGEPHKVLKTSLLTVIRQYWMCVVVGLPGFEPESEAPEAPRIPSYPTDPME